jgi:hypothetical protein
MANNRLYLVDTLTNEHILLAKGWGAGWVLKDAELLEKFLEWMFNEGEENKGTSLMLGTENDEEFMKKYIDVGERIRKL